MKIDVSEDMSLYNQTIELLKEIRLIHGPSKMSGTLRNHPNLRNFLTSYQKGRIETYDLMSQNIIYK